MNKKLKIYLDTSVINFLFADDAPEKKEVTVDFFENYLSEYDVFISNTVIDEINRTLNEEKKNLLLESISKYNIFIYNIITPEIIELAKKYIERKVVPEGKFEDTLHIAFATYYEFDILLSWNFKHLANIKKQEIVNIINQELSFRKILTMTNPMEVIYEK